ncbi:MAG: hypothetical protein WCY37_05755 [Candidatus Dojkabacteria bacterium]
MRKEMKRMNEALGNFEKELLKYKRMLEGSIGPEGEHLAIVVGDVFDNAANLRQSIAYFEEVIDR